MCTCAPLHSEEEEEEEPQQQHWKTLSIQQQCTHMCWQYSRGGDANELKKLKVLANCTHAAV